MNRNFKLIIAFLIISIGIIVAHNIFELNNQMVDNQYNVLINEFASISSNFNIWIKEKEESLNTAKDIVDNFSYDDVFQEHTENPYFNINNDDPDISQIYVGTVTGEFFTGGQWIPPEDYDPRTRVWYQEAIHRNEMIISNVYVDRETNDTLVTISSPLYMAEELVGVISADVFLKNISDYIENQVENTDAYVYLLNSDGTLIIHTSRPELIGDNLYTDIKNDVINNYFEEASRTDRIIRMSYISAGHDIKGIIQHIDEGEWYLTIAKIEEKTLLFSNTLPIDSIVINIMVLTIITTLIVIIIKFKRDLVHKNTILQASNEHDFLTGIFNRKYFNYWMEKLWSNMEDYHSISILMLDLDSFKSYNDTYGHIKGDEALVQVTNIITNQIRNDDVFARYGGEEFSLVIINVSLENTIHIAEKIIQAIYDADIENKAGIEQRLTISIGCYTFSTSHSPTIQEAINRADQALYDAKDNGRNTYVSYEDATL